MAAIDFVSFRNNFNKIMGTPWGRNAWQVRVQRVGATLFFDIVHENRAAESDPAQAKFTYWGYKFEQLCTQSTGTTQNTTEVNPANQFCALYRLKFDGPFRCLVAAEIDCFDSKPAASREKDSDGAPSAKQRLVEKQFHVELKTSKLIETEKDDFTFRRYKLLSYWIQSYLVATPAIVVGFRDSSGIVHQLETYDVHQLPGLAKDFWKPSIALNFTSQVLRETKRVCVKENVVYSILFRAPFSHVTIEESSLAPFLPAEFVKWCSEPPSARAAGVERQQSNDK